MAGIHDRGRGSSDARAVLQAMLPRLADPPHAILGVSADANAETLRAAFLRLTKQFHPTRFAREPADVVRMANEVFLTIKRSYDQLAAARRSSPIRVPTQPTLPPARPPSAPRITAAPTRSPTEQAWQQALDLLSRKLWRDARQVFHKLAAEVPQDKRYRAHMHYARAREALDAGRPDEARAELQRSLALSPDLVAARRALDDLPPPGGNGLLSKIFKR